MAPGFTLLGKMWGLSEAPLGVEQSPVGRSWGSGSQASRALGCSGFSEEHRRGWSRAVTPSPPAPGWSVKGNAPGLVCMGF